MRFGLVLVVGLAGDARAKPTVGGGWFNSLVGD